MHKETPKWLDLFITVFGPKGLVAMAWWLGSLHARRIRGLQDSFPFLHVDGDAGVGKSTLFETLWRLTGIQHAHFISPAHCTPAGLTRGLFNPVNLPAVLEQFERSAEFDWDMLKPLYNNCTSASLIRAVDPAISGVTYESAIAVVGWVGESPAFASRMVNLRLLPNCHTPERIAALQELAAHCANEFAPSNQLCDLVSFCMGKTDAYITGLRDDMGEALDARAAKNHAQILCLLDALDQLYGLPDEVHRDAYGEVWDMAWNRVHLPF